jgi:hypothetical protein
LRVYAGQAPGRPHSLAVPVVARRAARWLIIQTIRRGSVWIRLDRRGTQPEQARSVGSRPDRRGALGYGSGDRAPRWVRASGLRSAVLVLSRPTVGMVMGAVLVDGSAASCPAGLLPQCPHDPAAVAGSTSPGGPDDRCPQLRHLPTCPDRRCPPAAPAVGASGRLVSAGRAGLSWLAAPTSRHGLRRPPTPCSNGDCRIPPHSAAAGRSLARAPQPAECPGGLRHRTPRRPLSAPTSATMAKCPDSCCPLRTLRPATGSGCPAGVR